MTDSMTDRQPTPTYRVVGANIDTWILNIHSLLEPDKASGLLAPDLDEQLETLKQASQEADEDIATDWSFNGQMLYVKAHGSGRQWRYILHNPSLHLDIGRGKLNGIVGKARLASVFLWEQGPDVALDLLYRFLVGFYGECFTLQVSEVHLCADIAGWELSLNDANAFITRGHNRTTHSLPALPATDANDDEALEDLEDVPFVAPAFDMNMNGRRCTGYEFSKGGTHSCCLYDKTKELTVSRKEWMQAVWEQNGWDGVSRVTRTEFRYKRECLHEMGIEDPYTMLDQLPGMWAYSSSQWLRHTLPTDDTNRGRWLVSPFWQAIQQAEFFGEAVPTVRERKTAGDLNLICQMIAGCSTTAAAFLSGELPSWDDGANFLTWFHEWMCQYLASKRRTFAGTRTDKQQRLGVGATPVETIA